MATCPQSPSAALSRPQPGRLGLQLRSLPSQASKFDSNVAHAGGLCRCSRTLIGCRQVLYVIFNQQI